MLYKPNFCCNCGEKIKRIEWNLLTSRRFCEVCSTENRKHDVIPRLAVGGGLLAAVFGFGSYFGNSGQNDGQMNISPVQIRSSVPPAIQSEERSQAAQKPAPILQPPAATENDQRQFASRSGPAAAYFCGAMTKKGTPCSRRVKKAGLRCYQHEGKAPALPEN